MRSKTLRPLVSTKGIRKHAITAGLSERRGQTGLRYHWKRTSSSFPMALKSDPELGINSWLEDELYPQYLRDRSAVDDSWKEIFEKEVFENGNGTTVQPAVSAPAPELTPTDLKGLQPLRGAAGKIAENMSACLSVPLATSQRTIAVK